MVIIRQSLAKLAPVAYPALVAQAATAVVCEFRLDSARSATDGSDAGRLILVADRNRGTLAGAGIVGAGADDWISEASVAIRGQVPIRILADVVHPFPTRAQAYEVPLRDLARQLAANPGPASP